MYAGAVICLGGLIFAGIRMMSGRFPDAIPGVFGALFGAGLLGWGAGCAAGVKLLLLPTSLCSHPWNNPKDRDGLLDKQTTIAKERVLFASSCDDSPSTGFIAAL